jgi:hypothetical protein
MNLPIFCFYIYTTKLYFILLNKQKNKKQSKIFKIVSNRLDLYLKNPVEKLNKKKLINRDYFWQNVKLLSVVCMNTYLKKG